MVRKNPANNLRRVGMKFVHKEMLVATEPIVAVSKDGNYGSGKIGKPIFIAFPYSPEMEETVMKLHLDYVNKKYEGKQVSYDEYKKMMMIKALEHLQANKIMVTPGHVIAAENLEETKKQNKLMATELLLEAAKFWAGSQGWVICSHCGHQMIPKEMADERKLAAAQELENGKDGNLIPADT